MDGSRANPVGVLFLICQCTRMILANSPDVWSYTMMYCSGTILISIGYHESEPHQFNPRKRCIHGDVMRLGPWIQIFLAELCKFKWSLPWSLTFGSYHLNSKKTGAAISKPARQIIWHNIVLNHWAHWCNSQASASGLIADAEASAAAQVWLGLFEVS